MIDRREQVLAAIKTALDAVLPGRVERNRTKEVNLKTETPRLVMLDGGHELREDQTGEDEYRLSVDVDIYAAARSDAELGPALNTLWAEVVKALQADLSLGGLTQDIRQADMSDPEVLKESGAPPAITAQVSFDVFFATAERDPFTAP